MNENNEQNTTDPINPEPNNAAPTPPSDQSTPVGAESSNLDDSTQQQAAAVENQAQPAPEAFTQPAVEPVVPAATAVAPADTSPKSYLATFLLATFLMPTGASRAYLGQSTTWLKVAVVTYAVILLVPFFGIIVAGPVLFVLLVIGLIDFFKIYALRNNLGEHGLVATEKDLKYAKVIYVIYVVTIALYALAVIASMVALVTGAFSSLEYLRDIESQQIDSINSTDGFR